MRIADLPVRHRVFDGNSRLVADLREQLDVVLAESAIAPAADVQRPQYAVAGEQRDADEGLQPFPAEPVKDLRRVALGGGAVHAHRLPCDDGAFRPAKSRRAVP